MFKRALVCLAIWAMAGSASAEIWGYVDAQGVGHFSAAKLDDRYELFSKGDGPQAFPDEASQPDPSAHEEPPAPTLLSPKLAAFFESSQVLKAVRPHMQAAAQKHNIDVELLQALIATESGFNITAISNKGALGLMQLIPETAARYGVVDDAHGKIRLTQMQKLFDPQTNINAGVRYLRDLVNLFKGQLDLALAAYNAGEGAVQKAGNQIPNYPETQNYVRTVMQMYTALKPPLVQATPAVASQPKPPAGPDPLRPTKGRGNGLPLK